MKKLIALLLSGILLFSLCGCEIYEKSDDDSIHEHDYEEEVLREATCEDGGKIKYSCYCGEAYIEKTDSLDYHDWTDANCIQPKTCAWCGLEEGEKTDHIWKEATCTAPKTCTSCGLTMGVKNSHNWKSATCTTPKTCKSCGASTGSVASHSWKSATCTTPKTCTSCGKTSGQANGHNYYDGKCWDCGQQDPTVAAMLAKCSLTVPALPCSASYIDDWDNSIMSTVSISGISYEFDCNSYGEISLDVTFSGNITYRETSYSSTCFAWKLYNANGSLVEDGYEYVYNDNFTVERTILYSWSGWPAGSYKLVITDYQW